MYDESFFYWMTIWFYQLLPALVFFSWWFHHHFLPNKEFPGWDLFFQVPQICNYISNRKWIQQLFGAYSFKWASLYFFIILLLSIHFLLIQTWISHAPGKVIVGTPISFRNSVTFSRILSHLDCLLPKLYFPARVVTPMWQLLLWYPCSLPELLLAPVTT